MEIWISQLFSGLSIRSILLLASLGLAFSFGLMKVINMAHGEFMILGAYVTAMTSKVFAEYIPGLFAAYFFLAIVLAFIASGALGMLVEQAAAAFLVWRGVRPGSAQVLAELREQLPA